MADGIRIEQENLRQAAAQHQGASDYLATVPSSHPDIQGFLGSLGPIFGGFRAAGMQVLDRRRQDYERQARHHLRVADGLHEAANRWDTHESDSAQQMRGVIDT
ncbi:ESX-1 secretion-associated protein [Mycolicibacterium novocastrense]|uniref:ESX-1 secretion-associated protein n=1 Tax=Mycolicibacterium novocastrense TaxID=59813 RepID=A0AAW5SSY7_MYCNV|nr:MULTISPECIES: type VII secretion target [Mycolicibacterium]MCV7026646.1 ESX-1 secretion-associated protein [Mycolicibacterium novocastrense]MDX1887518.1 type VII secretion target [Mycolicibacterium sp. 120270]GAT07599.1 uncharacterized protein RMCN_0732 [Mycolicibacterium novocastrense]